MPRPMTADPEPDVSFAPVNEILDELKAGRMVVLVDDETRENEGDLIVAAEHITPEIVNFMVTHARGVLCVAMDPADCDRLALPPQANVNTASLGTAFTVTVDAHQRYGVTTGVSASDRSTTIKLLADPKTQPADLLRPGHINPLRCRTGGVLVRTGQTEGSVDLCKLAGLRPAAVIIEIMNDDGSMARRPELEALCAEHNLKMCTIADVVAHRLEREKLVERVAEAPFETPEGEWTLVAFRSLVDPLPHVALCLGRVGREVINDPVLVRVHAQNLLGDVFTDLRQPTASTLRKSMQMVQAAGEGAVVYIRQDAMGAGLLQRLETLHGANVDDAVADGFLEQLRSDSRTNIGVGSQILHDLGLRQLRLLTNHPQDYHALAGFGLSIVENVAIPE
ncbi:MAG: 3,4-dihydroxy-2-butanone-4-phosphate synthase [Phycisphaera sp.]|nr:3,4-dihydroxy-2-butanone-4-phosphate synthase [Phycisphaera sp.]